MNKFADWVEKKDVKQRGVARKIGVSTSTLHEILRLDKIPSLKVAYEIEKYTNGDITLYDWVDQNTLENKQKAVNTIPKPKKRAT